MNPEIKQKWIAALRSEEYQQGFKRLKKTNCNSQFYCCLGVLCDLHAKATGGAWYQDEYEEMEMILPTTVQLWAELPSQSPDVITDNVLTYLAKLNDRGVTFKEIAALIEKQL